MKLKETPWLRLRHDHKDYPGEFGDRYPDWCRGMVCAGLVRQVFDLPGDEKEIKLIAHDRPSGSRVEVNLLHCFDEVQLAEFKQPLTIDADFWNRYIDPLCDEEFETVYVECWYR